MSSLTEIKINGWIFDHICEIVPETDENGILLEFLPQKKYTNTKKLPIDKYGKGPFCRFRIDKKFSGKAGVYIISINNKIQYVGECVNFYQRFNAGYGNISPRNCFLGGQPTNCRINSNILKCSKSHNKIQLYFFESNDRHYVEYSLIRDLKPPWNRARGKLHIST